MMPSRARIPAYERGAATLVVVMVLFLVMALLAAYANRGLLFEQRIAASYSRSAAAQEAAEGAVEWALAQLNGAAVDSNCAPKATSGQRFVDKYLMLNSADRSVSLVTTPANVKDPLVDCTRDVGNAGWACRCPDVNTRVAPAAMGGGSLTPSFGLQFQVPGARNGTFNVTAIGCSDSVIDNCIGSYLLGRSQNQIAKAVFTTTFALVSAVRTPPAAPLIVKGNLDMTGTGLGLHNTDPRSSGTLLAIGGDWSGMNDERMQSVPGTSPNQVRIRGEQTLNAASADDVFKMFMGALPSRYAQHPSLRKVTCNGDCANDLQAAYDAGKRILWVDGNLSFGSNKTLGSATDPVLIIATGNVTLGGPFVLSGMLATTGNLSWSNTGGAISLINGIVLVGGSMTTDGAMDIVYQQAIANQLNNRMGSFVRVPGGWIDTN